MSGDAPFDLEAAVAALLTDPNRSALDLPRMTTGQRKQARKFIEEQSGLACESVGLSTERRLRVLKLNAAGGVDGAGPDAQRACEITESQTTAACVNFDEPFDAEADINAFLADVQRRSLELPHMTTGQRKHTRKLVEMHPELTCESYGLGTERRLHIFKSKIENGEEMPSVAVQHGAHFSPSSSLAHDLSVRNTFIDGFAEELLEPIIFRSMPVQLPGGALPKHLWESRKDATEARSERREGDFVDAQASEGRTCCYDEQDDPSDVSPVGSTSASQSSTTMLGGSGESTPHTLPEGLRIRNTFICDSPEPNLDTRVVRSMPHGMFKQCLLEEMMVLEKSTGSEPDVAQELVYGEEESIATPVIAPGTEVVIQGLTKCPDFNGLVGIAQSLDEAIGRYDILLPAPEGTTNQRWAKVKRENLNVAVQPQPPCHLPSLPELASSKDAAPLHLSALLPEVDSAQSAAIGNLASDLGRHCNIGASFAPYGPGDWNWYCVESFLSWGSVPSTPVPA